MTREDEEKRKKRDQWTMNSRVNVKPIKTDLETISCPGGMVGYQEGCKNALDGSMCHVGAARSVAFEEFLSNLKSIGNIFSSPADSEKLARQERYISESPIAQGFYHCCVGFLGEIFEHRAQARSMIDNLGNVETHYGHLYKPDLMSLQEALVSTGLWEMIPNNLGQPDDYWARRVR